VIANGGESGRTYARSGSHLPVRSGAVTVRDPCRLSCSDESTSLHVAGQHPHRRQVIEPHVRVAPRPLSRRAVMVALGSVAPADAHCDTDVRPPAVVDVVTFVPASP
jgi:hypothetical protein